MEILVSLFGMLIPIIAIIATFSAIGIPLYHHIRTRHLERMALIEKGIVTEDVQYLYSKPPQKQNSLGALKWGLIFVFVGIGLLVAQILSRLMNVDEVIYFALVSIGAGAALLVFYRIALKRQSDDQSI
jgi:uncharacterized membrane protein